MWWDYIQYTSISFLVFFKLHDSFPDFRTVSKYCIDMYRFACCSICKIVFLIFPTENRHPGRVPGQLHLQRSHNSSPRLVGTARETKGESLSYRDLHCLRIYRSKPLKKNSSLRDSPGRCTLIFFPCSLLHSKLARHFEHAAAQFLPKVFLLLGMSLPSLLYDCCEILVHISMI